MKTMLKDTVSLEEARTQIKHWRQYYTDAYNFYQKYHDKHHKKEEDIEDISPIDISDPSIFKGFFVKLDDLMGIKDIIDSYLQLNKGYPVDNDKIGIRVYLAKKTDYISDQKNMHVLIVPVIDNVDILDLQLSVNNGSTKDTTSTISTSTIFDFSRPCPPNCGSSGL